MEKYVTRTDFDERFTKEYELTYGETQIEVGDPVVLEYDNKITKAFGKTGAHAVRKYIKESESTVSNVDIIKLTSTKALSVYYKSSQMYARILNISPSYVITKSAEYSLSVGAIGSRTIKCVLLEDGKVMLTYIVNGTGIYSKIISIASDDSITVGSTTSSEVTGFSYLSQHLSCKKLDTDKVIISFMSDVRDIESFIATVSGTTITYNSTYNDSSATGNIVNYGNGLVLEVISTTKVGLFVNGCSGYGACYFTLTISGTSISYSSFTEVVAPGEIGNMHVLRGRDNVFFVVNDSVYESTSYETEYVILELSNDATIKHKSTQYDMEPKRFTEALGLIHVKPNSFLIFFENKENYEYGDYFPFINRVTVKELKINDDLTVENGYEYILPDSVSPINNLGAIMMSDGITNDEQMAILYANPSYLSFTPIKIGDLNSVIGIAQKHNDGKITLNGGTAKHFSGLSKLKNYYMDDGANITATATNYKIGTAVSETEMFLDFQYVGKNVVHFDESGSWTVPSDVNFISFALSAGGGGGGGGGSGFDASNAGGGGGGGATGGSMFVSNFPVKPGKTYSFTLGAGGLGGKGGTGGGDGATGSTGGSSVAFGYTLTGGSGGVDGNGTGSAGAGSSTPGSLSTSTTDIGGGSPGDTAGDAGSGVDGTNTPDDLHVEKLQNNGNGGAGGAKGSTIYSGPGGGGGGVSGGKGGNSTSSSSAGNRGNDGKHLGSGGGGGSGGSGVNTNDGGSGGNGANGQLTIYY